jgi:PAS domain S-box-containing protein
MPVKPTYDALAQTVKDLKKEIARHKQVEHALRQSEEKYRQLHKSLMDAYAVADMTGRITEPSPSYQAMLGYSREELMRLTYSEVTPKRWHALEARIVEEQVLGRGYSEIYEKEYRSKDGTIFPVEVRSALIRDDEGNPAGMWAVVRDLSARKQAMEELRQSEAKFRALTEVSGAGICIFQGEKFVYVNPAFEKMTGYGREELLSMCYWEIMDPEMRQLIKERGKARQRGEDVPGRYECKILTRRGKVRWIDIAAVRMEYEGKPAVLGTAIDITARKQAEEESWVYARRYRSLFQEFQGVLNAIPDVVCLLSPDLRVVWANGATVPTFEKHDLSGVVGRYCYKTRHDRAEPCEPCPVTRCFVSGKMETEKITWQGGVWELRAVPIFDDKGGVQGAVEVGRKIGECPPEGKARRKSEKPCRRA